MIKGSRMTQLGAMVGCSRSKTPTIISRAEPISYPCLTAQQQHKVTDACVFPEWMNK